MENVVHVSDPPFDPQLFTWRDSPVNGIHIIWSPRDQQFVAPNSSLWLAVVSAIEARYRLKRARLHLHTENQALSVHHFLNKCRGSQSLLSNPGYISSYCSREGVPLELFYPHLDQPCMRFKIQELMVVDVHSRSWTPQEQLNLLETIKDEGPVVAQIPIYSNHKNSYEIYDTAESTGQIIRNDGILLVGGSVTDDKQSIHYFEFQHSMGCSWGWKGFGRVKPSAIAKILRPKMGNFADNCLSFPIPDIR